MNKLTKVLSVFVLAGAIGTGVAGVAGCTKNNDNKHTCDYEYTQISGNAEKHNVHCKNDGHEGGDTQENHNWKDGKCEKCDYPQPSSSAIALPEGVNDLIVEGVTTEYVLSATATSANIPLTGFDVFFAKGTTKGDKVPTANWKAGLYKGSTKVDNATALKEDAAYTLSIELVNVTGGENIIKDISITVKNPIASIALKTGTTTQAQSATNSMVSTWTFEATRANGDKEDVAASDVTVSSIDTTKAGKGTATLTYGGKVLGNVEYEVTAVSDKVTQSYALNFSALTPAQEAAIKAQAEGTHDPLELQGGRFAVCSTKSGEIADHKKSFDGKYFAKRLKMNAASTASKCPRYIKVHADGPATLTVYAYCNTGVEGTVSDRKVAVYGAMTVTDTNPTATFTEQVGQSQATTEKVDTKHTFSIPAEGDYYIVSEVNGVCFTYVQLDQLVSSTGNQEVTLGGTVVASSVTATHSSGKSAHVALGTTFDSIKSAYTVKILGVNNVTCASGETDVTSDSKVTFEAPADFATTIGEKTITVKYDNQASSTFKVYVESAVSGIYGMTSALKSTVSTQVAAGTKFTLKKSDIESVLLGASDNANAQISAYTVTYNSAEVTEDGMDFAISATAYTVTVTATVGDGTNTDTLTATVEFTVSARSTASKQVFTTPETVPATATVAKGGTITENNLFKAVADGEMTYSEGDPAKSTMTSGKVSITLKDGTKKIIKTGLRTAATATAGDKTSSITITANEKITIRIYVVFSNSSYNSNKTGKLNYKVGNGEVVTVDTGSNRNEPNVIEVTLEAGQSITIDSDKGSDKGHLYLFGIEAEEAE